MLPQMPIAAPRFSGGKVVEMIASDWQAFDRIVIEGRADRIEKDDPQYAGYLAQLGEKNRMAAYFTEHGELFRILPRRIILMKGLEGVRHIVDFAHD